MEVCAEQPPINPPLFRHRKFIAKYTKEMADSQSESNRELYISLETVTNSKDTVHLLEGRAMH